MYPVFFKDIPLHGLMRTSSRSESTNSIFYRTLHWGNSITKFFRAFESTMDRQRATQLFLDHCTNEHKVKTRFFVPILEHAASVYTKEAFIRVMREVDESILSCSQFNLSSTDVRDTITVRESHSGNLTGSSSKVIALDPDDSEADEDFAPVTHSSVDFTVVYDKKESTYECSCAKFFKHGYLCRHIFVVFRTYLVNEIPENYIVRRWRKNIIPPAYLLKRCGGGGDDDEEDGVTSSLIDDTAKEVVRFVKDSLYSMSSNPENIKEFYKLIKEAKLKVDGSSASASSSCPVSNEQDTAHLTEVSYGVTKPDHVFWKNPPDDISNKGCGKGARLRGYREVGYKVKKTRKLRYCNNCGEYVSGHNARSCEKIKRLAMEKAAKEKSGISKVKRGRSKGIIINEPNETSDRSKGKENEPNERSATSKGKEKVNEPNEMNEANVRLTRSKGKLRIG